MPACTTGKTKARKGAKYCSRDRDMHELPLEIGFDPGYCLNSKPFLRGKDGNLCRLKVLFVPGDDMISRYCLSTCELHVVLKVGQGRGERLAKNGIAERDEAKPLHRGLSICAGLPFTSDPQSEEIEQWHG